MAIMRVLSLIFCALAVFASSRMACADELPVSLPNGMVGTLNLPTGATDTPAVLMLHGFGSSRDEVGGLYARLAAALAERGIASLRFDFRGFGKSDGDTGDTTIDGELADARTAADFLATQKGVDPHKLGLLGFSLGGGIAILEAGAEPERFTSLVVWSSVGDFRKDFEASLGTKAFETAERDGIVGLDLGWRTMALRKGFFASLDGKPLAPALAAYPGAFLAIAGEKDNSAGYIDALVKAAKGTPKEPLVIPGADHMFGATGEDPAMGDDVVRRTADWFKRTLTP